MIHDSLENLGRCLPEKDYRLISSFLEKTGPDMEEKRYIIDGDRIFANVMSYATKPREECRLEAHDRYIDIQSTIIGAEGIDLYIRDGLEESEEYDVEKDVVFFSRMERLFTGHVNNLPGYFTLIKPDEAHAPQERVGDIGKVKKLVIKYAV